MAPMLEINDLKERARRRVPKMFFDYADSGSWTESTYKANESDFGNIKLRQRIAVDMTNRTLATKMIGQDVSMPVALAPAGLTGMMHADGEILAAQAAEEFGVPFTLSTVSICSIEAVAAKTTKPFWFQLYVMKDRDFINSLIDRAKNAGCSALVLTFDLQILGQRHKDLRNGLSAPPKFTPKHIWQMATRPMWCMNMLASQNRSFGNIVGHAKGVSDLSSLSSWTAEQFDPRLSWDDIEWIKKKWGGPLILKGILDKEDARHAVDHGCDAIIVSNHGGRQLDGAHPPSRSYRKSLTRSGTKWRSTSMAAFAPVRMCSRPSASAQKAPTSADRSCTDWGWWKARRNTVTGDHPKGIGYHHGVVWPPRSQYTQSRQPVFHQRCQSLTHIRQSGGRPNGLPAVVAFRAENRTNNIHILDRVSHAIR